jgi:hypothetical protein
MKASKIMYPINFLYLKLKVNPIIAKRFVNESSKKSRLSANKEIDFISLAK